MGHSNKGDYMCFQHKKHISILVTAYEFEESMNGYQLSFYCPLDTKPDIL